MKQETFERFIPNEVLVNIPKGQSPKFLYTLRMVCRRWNNVLKPEYVTMQIEAYYTTASCSMYMGEVTNITLNELNFKIKKIPDTTKYYCKFIKIKYETILPFLCGKVIVIPTTEYLEKVDYELTENNIYFPINDVVVSIASDREHRPNLDYCIVGTMIVPQNPNELCVPETMIIDYIVDSVVDYVTLFLPQSHFLIYNMKGEWIEIFFYSRVC